MRRRISQTGVVAVVGALVALLLMAVTSQGASAKSHHQPAVLYVGTFHSIATPAAQTFSTIQGAVKAAQRGDWILIAPGDYHENGDASITGPNALTSEGWYGGVVIDTGDIHLRGMNRNSVIVDGTLNNLDNTGVPCSSSAGDQNLLHGLGRNGILVWKAGGVDIDNLTVCNFEAGSGSAGNEIWWNGQDDSGKIGVKGYEGSYLTATNTYFTASNPTQNQSSCDVCAEYGVFSSNASGGSWNQIYANNFSDSGAYIGACKRACDVTVNNAWFEDNALGYSGTNSGGAVVIEHSKFDNNKEGLDTNTALNGDQPLPQDGKCPGNRATSTSVQISARVKSCWVFTNNKVFDNNNPNVPVAGTAGLGLTGGGMTVSGGRDDTVINNEFFGNDAWGIVFAPYPDGSLTNSDGKTCAKTGGTDATSLGISGLACIYDPWGNLLKNNKFSGNGSWGNPSNADFGNLVVAGHQPTNCFTGNTEWNGTFTTKTGAATNANVQDGYTKQTPATCGTKTAKAGLLGSDTDLTLLIQAECASGVIGGATCSNAHYPVATAVTMQPLPGASGLQAPSTTNLPTMPNPCVGAPSNAWCRNGRPV